MNTATRRGHFSSRSKTEERRHALTALAESIGGIT